jgi:hypothetical protein
MIADARVEPSKTTQNNVDCEKYLVSFHYNTTDKLRLAKMSVGTSTQCSRSK